MGRERKTPESGGFYSLRAGKEAQAATTVGAMEEIGRGTLDKKGVTKADPTLRGGKRDLAFNENGRFTS